jgi:hypothetical protein
MYFPIVAPVPDPTWGIDKYNTPVVTVYLGPAAVDYYRRCLNIVSSWMSPLSVCDTGSGVNTRDKYFPISAPEQEPGWGTNKRTMAVIFRYMMLALVLCGLHNVDIVSG